MEDMAAKASILRIHLPLGIAISLLTLIRIGWWLWGDKKPEPVVMSCWQQQSARLIHTFFYVVILGMTASGIGMMILSGAGPIIFGDDVSLLPNFWDYSPRIPHGLGARIIIVLFVLHVGAALYHHIIKNDGLLKRMWF
jgi:cytochrome b561